MVFVAAAGFCLCLSSPLPLSSLLVALAAVVARLSCTSHYLLPTAFARGERERAPDICRQIWNLFARRMIVNRTFAWPKSAFVRVALARRLLRIFKLIEPQTAHLLQRALRPCMRVALYAGFVFPTAPSHAGGTTRSDSRRVQQHPTTSTFFLFAANEFFIADSPHDLRITLRFGRHGIFDVRKKGFKNCFGVAVSA